MKDTRIPVAELDPDITQGLTHAQAAERKAAGWDNQPQKPVLPPESQIVLRHCFTYFNLIFLVLAAILVLVGSSAANFGFLGVVVFNTAISVFQEIRAKRAVEKLTLVAEQTLKVLRQGKILELKDRELVRDDIVAFSSGAQICADAVVRHGSLQVDESLITGESEPVEKQPGDELMSGSFVVAGKALCQLIRVGPDSYAAKLATQARKDPRAKKSEMMRSLDRLIFVLGAVLVPLGLLYFLSEVTSVSANRQMAAEQTVAAMVSLIPQGLYLLTSVAMAVSALTLARKRVLVQDMTCIETLARVDVLCLDKTGTVTEPGMEVEELIPLGGVKPEYLQQVLGALYAGEPDNDTARALRELFDEDPGWKLLRRIPFASRQKWSGAVFQNEGAFLTGAPQSILGSRYHEVAMTVRAWTQKGYRVLLTAAYEGEPDPKALDPDRVTPLALILLTGRIRPEAPDTLRYFREQGVALKLISGDDPVTVAQIARRAGVESWESLVDAQTLRPEDLTEAAENYTVFGRVTPDQKQLLVKALKAAGHTVAMTGDGVNDVLAMRSADCAVAMAGGAQAASQVAQLVLLDGDFSAMPRIVGEGRRVVNNIQRAAALFLVKNIFTLATVLTALVSPIVFPFQPITLTLITALTVGLPSLFFALEPNYQRFSGDFLKGAFLRALPAGLAGFLAVVTAQIMGDILFLEPVQVATLCAAAQGAVGLLALVRVSWPLTTLRKWVVLAMALLLAGAFLVPGGFFGVDVFHQKTALLSLLCAAFAAVLFWAATVATAKLYLHFKRDKL